MTQDSYTWYKDGSSFLHKGNHRKGYAIVSGTELVEAQIFTAHICNQQIELTALMSVLQLTQGQYLNVYTDTKYVFHILLSCTAIGKKYRLLTAKEGYITNSGQMMVMIKASHLPKAIDFTYCHSQKTNNSIYKGNK